MFPAQPHVWRQCCTIFKDGGCDATPAQRSSYCRAHGEELHRCIEFYKGLEVDFEILLKAEGTYPMHQWLVNVCNICHDIANARTDVQLRFFSHMGADNIGHTQRILKLSYQRNSYEARLRSLPEEMPSPQLESTGKQIRIHKDVRPSIL